MNVPMKQTMSRFISQFIVMIMAISLTKPYKYKHCNMIPTRSLNLRSHNKLTPLSTVTDTWRGERENDLNAIR